MDYSSLRTAAEIITAFHKCQNAGEQIDLFEALATSDEPPISAFLKILEEVKLERLIVLTIDAFGKIKDADTRERSQQSEDLLAILSEKAQSGETDSIRLSAAKTVVNLGFDFIALSRYFREDPKKIADRITRDKLKEKSLFYAKYNEVRDLKSKLDRQLEQIKSINYDVYDRVIANNNFKDIPSVNIVNNDEYDLILNDYVQCLNILNDDDYVQSLRDESSRLSGETTKFYKDYKENQLAIIDDKIAKEKASLEKAKSAKSISVFAPSYITISVSLIAIIFSVFYNITYLSLEYLFAPIVYLLLCFVSPILYVRESHKNELLFSILLSFVPGGIFAIIPIKIFEIKIKSVKKNIKEAENQKVDELYRLDDEEQKILSLLSI